MSKLPHQQSTPEDSESLYDRLYQNGVAKVSASVHRFVVQLSAKLLQAAEKRSEEPSPAVKEPEHFDQPAVFTRLDSKPDPRRPAFRPTGSFRTRVSSSPEPSVAPRRRTVTETEKQVGLNPGSTSTFAGNSQCVAGNYRTFVQAQAR